MGGVDLPIRLRLGAHMLYGVASDCIGPKTPRCTQPFEPGAVPCAASDGIQILAVAWGRPMVSLVDDRVRAAQNLGFMGCTHLLYVFLCLGGFLMQPEKEGVGKPLL